MIDRFKDSFREEAYELLNTLEQSLLSLDDNPEDSDEISAVFRAMHTIKGSAAMFGFQAISSFTHEVENILDGVRNGKVEVSKKLIDLTLEARDHIRNLLEAGENVGEELESVSKVLLGRFQSIVPGSEQKTAIQIEPDDAFEVKSNQQNAETTNRKIVTAENLTTYRVRFAPVRAIMRNGTRPLQLIDELNRLGEITIVPYLHDLPEIDKLEPEDCYLSWDFVLTTAKTKDDILDVFIFVEGSAKIDVQVVDLPAYPEQEKIQIGKILVDRGVTQPSVIESAAQKQRRLGTILAEEGVPAEEIKAALEEQDHIKRTRQKVQQELSNSSIRVSSEKLDVLVDLVGELVTLQARLTQTAQDVGNAVLTGITESFERLTTELRDNTMSLRMLPIGTTFSRFKRLVRDLSRDLGKEAELETLGGETELDKNVLEKLNDPLVHLIRNSIDHGLESPDLRESSGKPRQGTVKLAAEHAGASVIITIEDDGRGLDVEAIRQKAIDRGLINAQTIMSDNEIQQLIFLPGFSTAKQITSVSGRGVGLDVVKKEIDNLGGFISLDSQKGRGAVFKLGIPLTLAIIEGLLVKVGEEHFVCPLSIVEECLEYKRESIQSDMLHYRDMMVPAVSLRDIFAIKDEAAAHEQVVVVSVQGQRLGLVVDDVIGDHQTVIKNLGKLYRDADGIGGATILGDGSVALILDVTSIIQRILRKEKTLV